MMKNKEFVLINVTCSRFILVSLTNFEGLTNSPQRGFHMRVFHLSLKVGYIHNKVSIHRLKLKCNKCECVRTYALARALVMLAYNLGIFPKVRLAHNFARIYAKNCWRFRNEH
jgi:hypothetical protein